MPYVIYKSTESPEQSSYSGYTWDKAGIRTLYKSSYKDKDVAERLAHVLSLHESVGFRVYEIKENLSS